MTIQEVLHANLTNEQYNAVVDESRHILCLACAGSGKSRTLAYKIAYLVSKGEAPESIVAFTFTEKAAESIKRRVAEALRNFGLSENYIGAMFIGTLDSFCQKLLGNIDAHYRQFDILNTNKMILFIMSRLNVLGLSYGKGYFGRIKELTNAWETLNNEKILIEDVAQYDTDLFDKLSKLRYCLDSAGYMDFSYAMNLAVKEVMKITDKHGTYIEKIKYLFVDEYQDINPIQEEFIKILTSHLDMLFVVGDDDQSIYGWRGANVQNIIGFKDRYADVHEHRLLINFRSTKAIVETANNFIQQAIPYERLPKAITYHADGNIQDLRKLWFNERADEARWVAERIRSLVGTTYIEYNADGSEKNRRGLTYCDFAVLLRSIHRDKKHNANAENYDVEFVNAMRNIGIPVKTSSEGGIFDRPYAQCILKIMELLCDESNDRSVANIVFNTHVLPNFPTAKKEQYFHVLQEWHQNIYASGRRKVYPQIFLHQLADALMLRDQTDETALRDLGLFSGIIKDVEQTYISIDDKWRYREMINFFRNIAQDYEIENLDYIAKIDAVNVSTIHKVKGLEFPVVFVVDMVNLRFPVKKSEYNGLLPEQVMLAAKNRGAYGNRQEDEARLFYTAITRAERVLYISGSENHPDLKTAKKRSAFIINLTHNQMIENQSFTDLAEKIEPKLRFDDNDLPTNFSAVKSYLICPFMYKLQSIFGYNATVPELFGFGKTSHTILERLHQKFKDRAPSAEEVTEIVESTFMLKHVFPSNDPINRPGSYERAKTLVQRILIEYSRRYAADFCRLRHDEARFEISVKDALITGAIDLLLLEDPQRGITRADVIDFKSMETPEDANDWRDMSIQVQLYSRAAKEVIGENVETGYIHTLKDNRRTSVPVDKASVDSAISVIEWAVRGILDGDFPMRACLRNCDKCDFKAMCAQKEQAFKNEILPPQINTPVGLKTIAAVENDTGGAVV
jgi:DNA helicase-2/ATP-dependent DNA helicase PcrA